MLTSYTVTFRASPTERLSPHALDEVKGLDNALTHALNLIRAGHQDVAIQDGTGKSVSGDLLMAAYGESRAWCAASAAKRVRRCPTLELAGKFATL